MERRELLALGGAALGLLAGCSGGGDGGATETATATATATETATATATATETATATATATETDPNRITHEVGERFTVGEGSNALTYTFETFVRADALGSSINEESADGVYLVAVLTLENPQSTPTDFPIEDVLVRGDGSRLRIEQDGTEAIDSDDRIDVDPIGFGTVPAGESRTGAVAYDVPAGGSYRIEITPIGDATTPVHVVPVGPIDEVEALSRSVLG